MKSLLLCLLLTLPAAAQRKLWAWTPPNQAEGVGHHLVRSASTTSGLTALIYLEADFNNLEEFEQANLQWKAALVSNKGQTLAVKDIDGPSTFDGHLTLESPANIRWQILSVGKSSIVMAEGSRVFAFAMKGKSGSITIAQMGPDEDVWGQQGGTLLPSYLKRTRGPGVGSVQWFFGGPGSSSVATHFNPITSLELWSLK